MKNGPEEGQGSESFCPLSFKQAGFVLKHPPHDALVRLNGNEMNTALGHHAEFCGKEKLSIVRYDKCVSTWSG